jgi:hypothetical protein
MPTNFLAYLKPATAEFNLERDDLMFWHSASEQFAKRHVEPGDTLWTVTVWPSGALTLLGRLIVGEITDAAGAAHALGVEVDEPWEANYHALAEPVTEQPLREVDVSDLAADLRFESKSDRLVVVNGRVHAGQLQTMRRLTPESAALLEARWNEAATIGESIANEEPDEPPAAAVRAGGGGTA